MTGRDDRRVLRRSRSAVSAPGRGRFALTIVVARIPARLVPVGLLARADLPRRGRPHAGQRQHRRLERLARLGPHARHPRRRPRRAQGLRPGVRRRASRSRTSAGSSPAPPRWSATRGRSSSASRRAARWSRPAAASCSRSRPGSRSSVGGVWLVTFALSRYTSVASIVSAIALPLVARRRSATRSR